MTDARHSNQCVPKRRVELKPEPREVGPPGSNSSTGMREPPRMVEPEPVLRAAAPKVEAPVAPRRAGVAEGSLPTAAERPMLQAASATVHSFQPPSWK